MNQIAKNLCSLMTENRGYFVAVGVCILLFLLQLARPFNLMVNAAGNNLFSKTIQDNFVLVELPSDQPIDIDPQDLLAQGALKVVIPRQHRDTQSFDRNELHYDVYSRDGATATALTLDDRYWDGAEFIIRNTSDVANTTDLTSSKSLTRKRIPLDQRFARTPVANFESIEAIGSLDGKTVIIDHDQKSKVYIVPGTKKLNPAEMLVQASRSQSGRWIHPTVQWPLIALVLMAFWLPFRDASFRLLRFSFLSFVGLVSLSQLLLFIGVSINVGAALFSVVIMTVYILDKRRRSWSRIAGVPKIDVLKRAPKAAPRPLYVSRINSYSYITELLSDQHVTELNHAAISRLKTCALTVYEVSPGIFAWESSAIDLSVLEDNLSGLHSLFTSPVIVGGDNIALSLSSGVDTNYDMPLRRRIKSAVVASRTAKEQKIAWQYSSATQNEIAERNLRVASDLPTAINTGEIRAAYQPKYCMKTHTVTGFEMLARWKHPTFGPIRPDIFVEHAERDGSITALTIVMIERAVGVITNLEIDVPISINVSPVSLLDDELVNYLKSSDHILDMADRIVFEITESKKLVTDDDCFKRIEALVDMGFALSIDDYGTGYSSMEYLKLIPASEIKVDKSLIDTICRDDKSRMILASIFTLAKSVNMSVIVEGIEHKSQEELLLELGATHGQGYLFSKPVDESEISSFEIFDKAQRPRTTRAVAN